MGVLSVMQLALNRQVRSRTCPRRSDIPRSNLTAQRLSKCLMR